MPRFLQMARLRITFKQVEHGWLQTLFVVEEKEYERWFSYVYSDALPQLCNVLRELIDETRPYVVTWMSEPEEHEMRFSKQGELVKLEMWRFEDHTRTISQSPYLEFAISGTYNEICLPFWRALRTLIGFYGEQEFKARWHYSFPTNELARLTEKLGKN